MMKKTFCLLTIAVLLCACSGKGGKSQGTEASASQDSVVTIDVKYATGFSVRDSADVRFVSLGKGNCFALVHSDEVQITIRAKIQDRRRNVVTIHVTVENAHNEVCAEGEVSYFVLSEEKSREMGFTHCDVEGDNLLPF